MYMYICMFFHAYEYIYISTNISGGQAWIVSADSEAARGWILKDLDRKV